MPKSFLVVALILAAVSVRAADQLLPTGEGTTWEYESTETLTGAAPVVSVVTVRAGRQLLDGKEVIKLETLSGNAVSKTELVRVDENGIVSLARSGKDGKITKLNPPQPIVKAPLKIGATWELEGEAAGMKMRQRFTVLAEENVTVPAGRYRAFHLQCEDSSLMSMKVDRWFVPGTGFVKETTVVRGPGMLQRITLELNKVTAVLAKPVGSPSPAAPTPTPIARPKSSPTPAPVVTPVASPTPAAQPKPSPTPAPVVTPVASPTPVAQPKSSPTPAPVVTPVASPSNPAASPEETATPSKKLTVEVSHDPAGGLKTQFKSDITNIYVRWRGHDLPDRARVRVAWVAEDVGDLVEPNFIIDETETVAPAPDASARFTLGRPPDGWAEGKYRVEFYVDDVLVETVRVTIAK